MTHLDTPLLALVAPIPGLPVKSTRHLISCGVEKIVQWVKKGVGEVGAGNDKRER
jgi:hypothetical protein